MGSLWKLICQASYRGFSNPMQIKRSLVRSNRFKRYFSSHDSPYEFLTNSAVQNYFDKIYEENQQIPQDLEVYKKESIRELLKMRNHLIVSLKELNDLQEENNDEELKSSIKEELNDYKIKLLNLEKNLFETLLPSDEASEFNEALIEVSPGVGGQEAMLFAKDIFQMYLNYMDYKGWDYTLAVSDVTELGGLRFGSFLVEGADVFKYLQFETGVHRVQRIPSTEKSGRVHTSTATVAVLPQPKEVDIQISDKDLIIETKRASGAGGQHVNKTDSAVRLTHIPSGMVVECQTERSQIKNRVIALKRLKAKMFQLQIENQSAQLRNMRKLQVGTSSRSDKIRTYNFNQDRITDHRLSTNFHNVIGFLEGHKSLDQLIEKLLSLNNNKRIELFLESIGCKV